MKKIIVDNNLICELLNPTPAADKVELSQAILFGRKYAIQMVWGGRLEAEYLLHHRLARVYLQLSRSGRLQKFPAAAVNAEERVVHAQGTAASDDPHILGLARVSGARVLCSHDQALHADFGNAAIIDKPRGKIWQHDGHNHLLK